MIQRDKLWRSGVRGAGEALDPGVWLESLLLAGLAFLLGRLSINEILWPFGPAFLGALSLHRPGLAPLGAVASAMGTLTAGGVWPAVAQGALGTFWVRGVLERAPGRPALGRHLPLLLAGTGLTHGLLILWQNPGPYGLLLLLFQAGLVGLLALTFFLGLKSLLGRVPLAVAGQEESLCGMFLLAGGLAGLAGIHLGPVALQPLVTADMLLLVALGWGGGAGAAAGVAAGAMGVLTGLGGAAAMGVSGLAGLLAGLFRDYGKWGVAAGLSLGYGLGGLAAGGLNLSLVTGLLAGILLFLVLPGERLPWLALMDRSSTGGALDRPGAGWEQSQPLAGGEGRLFASKRLRELAQVFGELSRSFQEVAATDPMPSPEQELARLINRLTGEVCHRCSQYQACWQKDFFDRYRITVELFAWAANEGVAVSGGWPEEWDAKCIHPERIVAVVKHLLELREMDRRWRRKLDEGRDLMASHLQGLARVLEDLSRETDGSRVAPEAGAARRARLGYATEVAKLAQDGRLVSGDSHLVKELPGDRLLFLLSDGMGAGDRAAAESRAAVNLIERFLDAGFDRKVAIRTVNSILVLRSPEETFATLDLALVDLRSGEAEFIKVGAAPTFVRRGETVRVVAARSLPLGILDDVELESHHLLLEPGDLLVMVTDGILAAREDAAAREAWIREALTGDGAGDGSGLARTLLEAAAEDLPEERRDDMTVLAVRFSQNL